VDFDHHSAEFAANRADVLRRLRSDAPIAWSESHGGFWFVASHALICEILRNDSVFVVERFGDGSGGITIPENRNKPQLLPGEVDGERHDVYRSALNGYFSKARVETLRPFVEGVVDELLDGLIEAERFDAVAEFALLVPARAVLTYTGIIVDDTMDLYDAVEHARQQPTADEVKDVKARLVAIVAEKRASGARDVLGELVRLTDPVFSDEDLVGLMVGLILGGVRTTADMIAHAINHLDVDRAVRARLAANPDEIPTAVEELLRVHTPILGLARTAMSDIEVGGQQIHAGDRLLLGYWSANQDEAKYAHAETFDLDRSAAQHLTFGRGAHFCLGSWLARLELQVVVAKVIHRMPAYRIDRDRATFIESVGLRNAWTSLPVLVSG
jgi:cytochrome P450